MQYWTVMLVYHRDWVWPHIWSYGKGHGQESEANLGTGSTTRGSRRPKKTTWFLFDLHLLCSCESALMIIFNSCRIEHHNFVLVFVSPFTSMVYWMLRYFSVHLSCKIVILWVARSDFLPARSNHSGYFYLSKNCHQNTFFYVNSK